MATESTTTGPLTFHASPYQTGIFGVWYEAPEHPSTKYDWAFDGCDLNEAQATTLAAAMSRRFNDLDTVDWDWVYKVGMAIGACDNCASEDFGDCPSCHLSTGFGCGHGPICDACDDFEKTGQAAEEMNSAGFYPSSKAITTGVTLASWLGYDGAIACCEAALDAAQPWTPASEFWSETHDVILNLEERSEKGGEA